MKNFEYAAPASLAEATSLLAGADGAAHVLAGGTDLLVQLRERIKDADLVVDLKRIPELVELSYTPGRGLRLGASVPCSRIHEHAEVAAAYPALAEATRIIGGWQIQSRASVGGNLCNASPAADSIPPLIVLRARCRIQGPGGAREVPAEAFCTGPGRNVLGKGEILATILIPPPPRHGGSAYERLIPRNEMDIAVVGAASWVRLDRSGERIEEARIALAAVAPTPVLAEEAGRFLAGKPATAAVLDEAGALARKAAAPISDMRGPAEYRDHLIGVLTRRTLARAVERARS